MNYLKIAYDDQLNGEGLRVVLFVSGCSHHCEGCQNPQTWDHRAGKKFDDKAIDKIFYYLSKDYIAGITLSGGDPLNDNNTKDILDLCKKIKSKYNNKTIWLYTGYTYEEVLEDSTRKEIMNYIDVMVDGRFDKNLLDVNYPWAGSTNQRIIDVNKSIKNNEIILYKSE